MAQPAPPTRVPIPLTENARQVLRSRYLAKNEKGEITETPEDLFDRVASAVASAESHFGARNDETLLWRERFYNLMASLRFLPNSPTLMNAGREMGMLSACFVLRIPDSIEGIFDAVKYTALIQKAGGGTGFSFDELRPTGDYISSSGGRTSGPLSFWRVLSETTNAIQQGAFRRGANMGMLSVEHPDILRFLHAKTDVQAFINYNVSVKISDAWMARLAQDPDQPHLVANPRNGKQYLLPRDLDIWHYGLGDLVDAPADLTTLSPEDRQRFWTLGQLWHEITARAHATGEPGVAFMDRINRDNMTPQLGRIEATNPCGEQPLLPYEACNLGSINLGLFIRDEPTSSGREWARTTGSDLVERLDVAALRETIRLAVRFLDDVIEISHYHIDRIDEMCRGNRKIGLGWMGFADALFKLHTPYDTPKAIDFGRAVMRLLQQEAHLASEDLARQRGSFPFWPGSRWRTEFDRPMRNATCTTVAPTGTISIIADCSGGIEPLFSVVFVRHVLSGARLLEVNRVFRQIAHQRGFYSAELFEHIARQGGLAGLDEIPDDVKRVFRTALDIAPQWHVRMQAAFQEHCDAAISKTINFPENAPVEHVAHIYRLAHELGCKGITIYRYGSRPGQPMAHDERPETSGRPVTSPTDLPGHHSWGTLDQSKEAPSQTSPEVPGGARIDTPATSRVRCPSCGEDLTFTEGCVKCQGCGYSQC